MKRQEAKADGQSGWGKRMYLVLTFAQVEVEGSRKMRRGKRRAAVILDLPPHLSSPVPQFDGPTPALSPVPPPAPPLSRRPRPGCVLDPRACSVPGPRSLYSRALCGVRSCVRCAAARRAARLELPSVGTPGLLWLAPRPREGPPPARLRLLRPLLGREDDLARVAVVRVVARLVRAHARDVRRRALRGLPLVPRHALVAANAEQAPPPPPRDLVAEEGVW